ncbi:MAG TPA: cyclic nucleotide-binding domain-containing protein [Haliangium sp.]|nr:cyclic nucleotide-binding domain-containing protein [Haliangium sp.]
MSDDDKPTLVDDAFELTELTSSSFLSRASAEERRPLVPQVAAQQRGRRVMAEPTRYHDRGRIAIGGMGAVHRSYDEVLQRQVAVKNLQRQLADSDAITRRFLQEVVITAQLDHPNIVPVYDVGFHDDGTAFFVMKLVRGENLAASLRLYQERGMTHRELERYLRIFLKVCEAVEFAHSRGVIHRDLKPSNIMVGPHGEVYVMDWGIALVRPPTAGKPRASDFSQALWGDTLQEEGMVIGTAAYMAPEQARGDIDDIDERTDIFALGGILYHILTNRPPYSGPERAMQILMAGLGEVLPPAEVVTGRRLPPRLCHIAMKALARQREDRYQSVGALMEDIEGFLRGGGWFEAVHFPAGTLIVREGDEPDAAYIIEQGHCEVYKVFNGKRVILRELGPGDVFGETSIFTGMPRTASVIAIDDVRAASITRESLDIELAEKGWLAAFVRGLAERFRTTELSSIELRVDSDED